MSVEGQSFYPGDTATPQQIIILADEYRRAADALRATGRRRQPHSRSPYRLVAIHAIELYLNAFLRETGHSAGTVRGLRHDLASRHRLVIEGNLCLQKRTAVHLQKISERREYLIARYDPAVSEASELNRLSATLTEVAEKVKCYVSRAAP